jgi:nucleoside-diphosphate-sugar epimerase
MKIAVTGGSGRIGRSVLETLVARGHEVINMDRRPATDRPGKFVYTELDRREMVQPALEQVEAVIHMGEIPSANSPSFNVEEIYARNTAAGAMVMQIAGELKLKKLIYASTVQVYGFCDTGHVPPLQMPVDETHPTQPQNVYGLSKVANERYCRLISEKMGLSAAIFRFPWVLSREPDDGWFKWLEMHDELEDGMGVYVKDQDVAEALALAVQDDRPGCQTYNLSADEVMSARPIREALELKFPAYPKLPADWPKYKSPYLADKAKRELSWQPKYNFLDEFRKRFGRDPNPSIAKGT